MTRSVAKHSLRWKNIDTIVYFDSMWIARVNVAFIYFLREFRHNL